MTMRLVCACGRVLGYEKRHIGQKVRCGGCGKMLLVPEPDRADPDDDTYRFSEEGDEAPRARSRATEPLREEAAVEERPRPRRRRRRAETGEEERDGFLTRVGGLLWSVVGVFIMVPLVCAAVPLVVIGSRENILARSSTTQPWTISLQELIDSGPGGNVHVLVTDVAPARNFIFTARVSASEKASGVSSDKPWESVYVPLLPLTPDMRNRMAQGEDVWPQVESSTIRVIMLSRTAKNQRDLQRIFATGEVKGTLVNSIDKIDPQAEKLLRQKYPATDFSRLLILEEGRTPSSKAGAAGMVVGGIALGALAAVLFLIGLIFHPRE